VRNLTIVYGLSGSGKSTMARKLSKERKAPLLELDTYFEIDGEYYFDAHSLDDAKKWLTFRVEQLVTSRVDEIIVCDVFCDEAHLKEIMSLGERFGYNISLVTPTTSWARNPSECFKKNEHHVPYKVVCDMLAGIESWEKELDIL